MRTPGYHGRYLRIDLSTRTWRYCDWPAGVLRQFLGGVGLGTWLLLSESRPRQDPLSAEAPVAIVFSPLVGSPLTTSAKFAVVSQSPLTDRINDSLSSSHFAIAGKKTGCDALLITGQSPVPVALRIQPDRVDFLDAAAWWGLSAQETGDAFRSEQGNGFRVAAIGVAGENLVRYATVSHDGRHAGRGGTGAVWGAKRLKAIGVQGDRLTDYAQPRELMSYAKRLSQKSFGPETAKYRELGTVSNLLTFNRLGTLPTRNFQQGEFESAQSLALENHAADLPRTRTSCAACTIGCEHLFVPAGRQSGVRMEYESLFALGSLCGIADPQIALQAVSLCDEYGLDTISTGG